MKRKIEKFSLRQVVDLTGISEFTLRGWESRYQAFKPRRTSTGRRVYSSIDLQKAILLRELIARNHRISAVARLSIMELEGILVHESSESNIANHNISQNFRNKLKIILKSISLQKWDKTESILRQVFESDTPRNALLEFVVPLFYEIELLVSKNLLSISQEHIFSALLKTRLHVLRDQAKKTRTQKKFVIAAPEGDIHEIGILMSLALISHSGFNSVYLGSNTPKHDLCETALRIGATHILLGSTISHHEGAKEDLYSYIHHLEKNLPTSVSLWIGGRNSSHLNIELKRETEIFPTLLKFEEKLGLMSK